MKTLTINLPDSTDEKEVLMQLAAILFDRVFFHQVKRQKSQESAGENFWKM